MAHFAKPSEGSWTEHYPELGTGPVSYEDSISPEHYELERKAIFGRTWLNVGRVEQLPRSGSYFTKELDAAGTSVVVVRGPDGTIRSFHNMCRHRGNKLVWNDYPQRRDEWHLPAVHLQVPRLAVLRGGSADLRAARVGVLRPRQGGLRAGRHRGRDVGGVHLREPRSRQHHLGAGVPGRSGRGNGRVSVRQDDPGLQVPGRCGGELEAVHRRLRRVLPRPDSPREAGDRRGVPQALRLRIRGVGLRARRAPRHGVVLGRDVATEGPRHGQADRAGLAQRTLRPVGPAPISTVWTSCPRRSTRPATGPGASTRSSSSPISWCSSGRPGGT